MIKRITRFLVLFFLLIPNILQGQKYEVTFLGIPVVQVSIEKVPQKDPALTTYLYTAKTNRFFSAVYPVNNRYLITMDSAMNKIVAYEKDIVQKNFEQDFSSRYTVDEIFYSTGEKRTITGNYHTILSMLLALSDIKQPQEFRVPLEIEGEFYTGVMIPGEGKHNQIDWNILLTPEGGEPVLEATDLFTSRLADPEARRNITVDISSGRIVSARFILSPYTLTARLLED